jgi:hypothetical protein
MPRVALSADGSGIVGQAGALLLLETLWMTGFAQGLSAGLERWRKPRVVHDPGKVVADLAVTLALSGGCLADIVVLRAEPELFGRVASDPTVSRLVTTLAEDEPKVLRVIHRARAAVPCHQSSAIASASSRPAGRRTTASLWLVIRSNVVKSRGGAHALHVVIATGTWATEAIRIC